MIILFANKISSLSKWSKYLLAVFIFSIIIYNIGIPNPLFRDPQSIVLEDKNGNLLGARIAKDGQWRFPTSEYVNTKFNTCLIYFEDKRFYYHFGVDPISISRALLANIKKKKVVSGGSTITMQLIRISKKNPPRTIWQKAKEATLAVLYECTHSKENIIQLYAANAPFGGNVVGVEAAAWRYFGKPQSALSWAENATLAVLPNAPSLIHPGKNQSKLLLKRNRLLQHLYQDKIINKDDYLMSIEEPLPDSPNSLPMLAPHLLDRAFAENHHQNLRFRSTIDMDLQQLLNTTVNRYNLQYKENNINNLCAVIIEVETGNIVAYTGNAPNAGAENNQQVDVIRGSRSTGSVLKPLLMAHAIQEGMVNAESLLDDIPIDIGGYKPDNFKQTYDGVVPLKKALARSLNIPFVNLLEDFGYEKFHFKLKKMGLNTISKSADYYGLSMILGGAESNLLELTNTYTCMARTLNHYITTNGLYNNNDWHKANYIYKNNTIKNQFSLDKSYKILNAASIWTTFDAMTNVERPSADGNWEYFETNKKVAWKTGTSFGFKDAWSIGVTPNYAVGVWVGNADGEGRPGCIGIEVAAPVMFDIFNFLPTTTWFYPPYDDMKKVIVCAKSGYTATDLCENDTVWVPKSSKGTQICSYHQLIHLDPTGSFRVSTNCEDPYNMQHKPWFVLPPIQEYYFANQNPWYQSLPPFRKDCAEENNNDHRMQIVYPRGFTKIKVPKDFNNKPSSTVFKVMHKDKDATVFWHIDGQYIQSTKRYHDLLLNPTIGLHTLTVVDERGQRLVQQFEIMAQ
jgi:penicillin-binding protein 1C